MAIVGFIGTGNMGSALARAAAKSERTERLLLSNRTVEKARRLAAELGCEQRSNKELAAVADYLFLAVKPQMLQGLLDEIGPLLAVRRDRFVVVSMVAGKDLRTLHRLLGEQTPVVRIMPNIPVQVGGGVTLLCADGTVLPEERETLRALLAASGMVAELEEHLLDAATGVTGCGPAFAALFVEALADGAVACGLPRKQALAYAAQMMMGTAKLLLETEEHPGALKDRVCSPGGSTIQGVRKLEERAFRAAVTDAVIAAYEKEF
jgi:pyrroline-5-carboxylate reductase